MKKIVKTYILRNGNIFSCPFILNGVRKRAYFSGSTPYNERSCGTFQTNDHELQTVMEESPLFNNVYDLWITSEQEVGNAPAQEPANAPAQEPENAPEKKELTKISVSSWAEAKMTLVDSYGASKFTRNDPESLSKVAAEHGVEFVVSK
jgi:hypothetical protein